MNYKTNNSSKLSNKKNAKKSNLTNSKNSSKYNKIKSSSKNKSSSNSQQSKLSNSSKKNNSNSKNNYYKNLYKNKWSKTNEAVLDNKTYVLPKHHEFELYFCVWRMYSLVDPDTKKSFLRRYWIVIGKGHKSYRKFDNQRDAIKYFRNLKKYAKMKIQSSNSKEFTRTIYTIFEMIYQGIDANKIFNNKLSKKKKEIDDNEIDYVDEYTQLDILLNDEDTETNNFDHEEKNIDEVINEKEGDTLVLDYKLDIDEDADKSTKEIKYQDIKYEYDETKTIETTQEQKIDNNYFDFNYDITKLNNLTQENNITEYQPIEDSLVDNSFKEEKTFDKLEPTFKNENFTMHELQKKDDISKEPTKDLYVPYTYNGNTELIYTSEVENQNNNYYQQNEQNQNYREWNNNHLSLNNFTQSSGNTEILIYENNNTIEENYNDNNNKQSIYDLISTTEKEFPTKTSNDLELEEDSQELEKDMQIIQHNTSLNEAINHQITKKNKRKGMKITFILLSIILVIGAIVSVVLLFIFKII